MDVTAIQRRGASIACQFINDGDFRPIQRLVDDTNAKELHRRRAGQVAINACVIALSRFLESTRRSGVRFTGAPLPTEEEIIYSIESGRGIGTFGTQLVSTVHAVRRAKPGIKVSLPREDAPKQSAPMPVQVVSMPSRKTASEITRNMAGEIVSSFAVESDI